MAARKPKKSKLPAKSHPKPNPGTKNLFPHPENLKKGGGKPRDFVTEPELALLNYILDGALKKDAWKWAGYESDDANLHEVLRRPLIAKTMKELQEKRKELSVSGAARRAEERDILLHGTYGHHLRAMPIGDPNGPKMFEVGWKSTGSIAASSVRVNTAATAGAKADATNQLFAKRLYLPDWRKEAIEKIQDDERNDSRVALPPGE